MRSWAVSRSRAGRFDMSACRWPCALMMPGMMVLPAMSTRVAPAGTATLRPTAWMRPSETTIVAPSVGAAPVPSMTRAPVNATTPPAGACACGASYDAAAQMSPAPMRAAAVRIAVRIMSLPPLLRADLNRPRLVRGNRAQEIGAVARADRVGEVDAVQRVVDLPEESRRALAPDPVHVLQPQVEQHLVGAFDAVADRHAVGVHLRDDGPRQVVTSLHRAIEVVAIAVHVRAHRFVHRVAGVIAEDGAQAEIPPRVPVAARRERVPVVEGRQAVVLPRVEVVVHALVDDAEVARARGRHVTRARQRVARASRPPVSEALVERHFERIVVAVEGRRRHVLEHALEAGA